MPIQSLFSANLNQSHSEFFINGYYAKSIEDGESFHGDTYRDFKMEDGNSGGSGRASNTTVRIPVPSSDHVAEIVGKQGYKIKALRANTNTYIRTPGRGEEPTFVVTGRREDVDRVKNQILAASQHFSDIREGHRGPGFSVGPSPSGKDARDHGHVTIEVPVDSSKIGMVIGQRGLNIKRIQSQTGVVMVTPKRDQGSIFQVTGQLANVERARVEILRSCSNTGCSNLSNPVGYSNGHDGINLDLGPGHCDLPWSAMTKNGNGNDDYTRSYNGVPNLSSSDERLLAMTSKDLANYQRIDLTDHNLSIPLSRISLLGSFNSKRGPKQCHIDPSSARGNPRIQMSQYRPEYLSQSCTIAEWNSGHVTSRFPCSGPMDGLKDEAYPLSFNHGLPGSTPMERSLPTNHSWSVVQARESSEQPQYQSHHFPERSWLEIGKDFTQLSLNDFTSRQGLIAGVEAIENYGGDNRLPSNDSFSQEGIPSRGAKPSPSFSDTPSSDPCSSDSFISK